MSGGRAGADTTDEPGLFHARIGLLAGPSQVLVSQTVKDLTAGSGITYVAHGEYQLKGVPDKWWLYAVAR